MKIKCAVCGKTIIATRKETDNIGRTYWITVCPHCGNRVGRLAEDRVKEIQRGEK